MDPPPEAVQEERPETGDGAKSVEQKKKEDVKTGAVQVAWNPTEVFAAVKNPQHWSAATTNAFFKSLPLCGIRYDVHGMKRIINELKLRVYVTEADIERRFSMTDDATRYCSCGACSLGVICSDKRGLRYWSPQAVEGRRGE